MTNTVAQKMKIKEGMGLLLRNAPEGFMASVQPLPLGVMASTSLKNYHQIHWFVANKMQLENELGKIVSLVKNDNICWVYYPKGTSKIQTDLTRDKGWDALLAHEEMHWISLISFDETWSAFGFRLKTAADKNKEAVPKIREIFNYINAKEKTIRLPAPLETALEKNPKANNFFQTLSFTNKKEYIAWVITAKREETKLERITGTIERLEKGWKNPRNL